MTILEILGITALIITFLVFVGKAIDQYAYKVDKFRWYKSMEIWVEKVSNTKFPNLHLLMIDWVLNFTEKFFNKKKLIRSIIITIAISWLLTTTANLIGLLHPTSDSLQSIKKWHDYLPWYPGYIVNLIFDFSTLLITITILKLIKGRQLFHSIIGIISDVFLAYSIAVVCYVFLYSSSGVFHKFEIGTSFISHRPEYNEQVYKSDPLNIKLEKLNFSSAQIKEILTSGFSEFTEVRSINKLYTDISFWFRIYPNAFQNFIKGKQSEHLYKVKYKLIDSDQKKTFVVTLRSWPDSQTFATSLTTVLPTIIYLLLLLVIFLSKEIFVISKKISLRLMKSALEQTTEEEIGKFKPGTHFGVLLSVISALIAIIIAIIKL